MFDKKREAFETKNVSIFCFKKLETKKAQQKQSFCLKLFLFTFFVKFFFKIQILKLVNDY